MYPMPEPTDPSPVTKPASHGVLLHEKVDELSAMRPGRIVRLSEQKLFSVTTLAKGEPVLLWLSDDNGATWREQPLPQELNHLKLSPTGAVVRTSAGTLIVAFANLAEKSEAKWDPQLRDIPDARLPTYVMRSEDEGRTWTHVQKLHDDWTGATRDAIETRTGRIVFTTMKLLHEPGRHCVLTYQSDDDGKTWQASNVVDLGGNGDHDGATESTIVELKDGTLLQYIRTPWLTFWRAISHDGGMHWHPTGPAHVPTSNAPGYLARLSSGRIALVWNRPAPDGETAIPWQFNPKRAASPTTEHRMELSLSFSEDECETWSPPVVIARKPASGIAYPFVGEAEPGVMWITAWRRSFAVKLREVDFIG